MNKLENIITDKGLEYAHIFQDCFTRDASDRYIHMFAKSRYRNLYDEDTLIGSRIGSEYNKYEKYFLKSFISELKILISKKPVKVEKSK